jgi:hypothetical protein
MAEIWQTSEAAAAEEEKKRRRAEWVAQVEAERAVASTLGDYSLGREPDAVLEHEANAQLSNSLLDLSRAPSIRRGLTLDEVSWPWNEWNENDIEKYLLGWVYRTRHDPRGGHRIAPGFEVSKLTPAGVPASEALLVPRAARQSGVQRVLETTLLPVKIAATFVLRDDDSASRADGTAKANCWKIREAGGAWREDEQVIIDEIEFRLKKLFEKWKEKGWLVPEPVLKFSEKDSSGFGRDGMIGRSRLTYKAIDAAEEQIRGTSLASGTGSSLTTATESQKQRAAEHAPWLLKELKDGAKAGT